MINYFLYTDFMDNTEKADFKGFFRAFRVIRVQESLQVPAREPCFFCLRKIKTLPEYVLGEFAIDFFFYFTSVHNWSKMEAFSGVRDLSQCPFVTASAGTLEMLDCI